MERKDDLQLIAIQEHELRFPRFDSETAWQLGVRLRELALDRSLAVVMDVRRFGQPLFYCALPGTSPDNVEWVRRKGNVVARFHRSSYAIGLELQKKNSNLMEKYALSATDYASHGGSFPVAVVGAGVIGSATISGLPQRADHELVVEALCSLIGRDYTSLKLPHPEA
jgi:uncharacterized protein (UPF0303 family)